MKKMFLTPNKYSRPQREMGLIQAIAIHWVGNAATSALFNRDYFEGLKDQGNVGITWASAHFCIDARDTIWCLPLDEMGYHVGPESLATPFAKQKFDGEYANAHCIGLELCHPDWTGKFESATLWRAAVLTAQLCLLFGLDPLEDVIRHHDVTGKECPRWFVHHKDEWEAWKMDVVDTMHIMEEFAT